MTSIYDCIQRAVDAKELNPVRGRAAQAQYDQLVARYADKYPQAQAQAMAAADLKEATRRAARSRYHAVVNQLQAMRRLTAAIEQAPDPALAIRQLLEHSEGSGFTGESVRSLTEAYNASIAAGLSEVLEKTGLNVVGNSRNRVLLEQLMDELHGTASGNAEAARLADAVRYQQRRMRQLFNAHGGDVGELADYGVPHAHSVEMLRKAGFDPWAEKIAQHLAWDKITDLTTGQPFAAAPGQVPPRSLTDRFLRDVYDGIVTRGWDDRDPKMTMGGVALYNQRGDHRVLHFKSGRDWMDYNREFGASDPFSAMMNGLSGLANDVAMMRVLGPNPRAGLEYAVQVAQKRAAELKDAGMEQSVTKQAALARTMFAHQSGAANVPENIFWASFFGGVRGFLTSVQLGSAVLSSFSDMATIGVAAKVIGMNPANVASRTLGLIASHASRAEAARMGYLASTLADAGGGSARYFGQLLGSGITQRMAGFTLRATGLSFLTDMRRIAFQAEFAGYMAEHAGRTFGDLPAPLRGVLESRGITASDWDLLRDPAARFVAENGADFISPNYWLEHQTALPRMEAEGLAMRLQMAIQEQMEMAIPSASLEGRARLQGEAAPGTFAGELLRSTTTYKSFAMSLMLNQWRRYQTMPTAQSKAAYAASMLGLLTLTGAFAIQLKELAKGNDPRPMDEKKFWLAAAFQGGGLGIFGDFFAAEMNRAGGGLAETLAGPTVSFAGDVIGLAAEPVGRLTEGKDANIGRAVAGFARRNTPFASSAWYARLAFDRLAADTLQGFLDADAESQWRRQQKQRERDYGTTTWWDRGAASPSRLPDPMNALGDLAR